MDPLEIIAHRGSSFLAPENTRAAVDLAWQEGADAVEGDFRLTRDGHIVCLHDTTLNRTAGVNVRVADCSLEELQAYDFGTWKGPQFAGQRIPTLSDLLATVPAGKRYYVEIKCGPEIIPELARVISACGLAPDQMVPICLQLPVIAEIKTAIPQCSAYWVVEFKRAETGQWQPSIHDIIGVAQRAGLNGLDLMASGPIDAPLVKRIKAAGLGLCVWTVDDPPLARRLIDLGITRLTTNRPAWLREQITASK
ncbi:MAG TPA: glycerophosphodiester phosphodiesterase [Pirellulales bacterium]|nr:glycerophosphodiester phosphodiesterase [Pirellulales bacterium]